MLFWIVCRIVMSDWLVCVWCLMSVLGVGEFGDIGYVFLKFYMCLKFI